jgi:membrane protease YdiL (CAAX protease family)
MFPNQSTKTSETGYNTIMDKQTPARYLIGSLLVCLIWLGFGPLAIRLSASLPLSDPYHTYLTVMAPSCMMALGAWVASRWFLSVPMRELIRPQKRDIPLFLISFSTYFLVVSLVFLLSKKMRPAFFTATHPKATTYVAMLLLILPINLLQCTAEEFMMRIIPSHSIKNRLLSSLLCMVLFVLPHLGNVEVSKGQSALLVLSYYAVFGFFGTWFSFLSGGFEFSLGVHMANNLFIAMVCNYTITPMQTSALFLSSEPIGTLKDVLTLSLALATSFVVGRKRRK